MLFSRVGRHREAVELAQRECEVTPQAPAAFNNLGNALKGAQKRDEAIAAFRRALELDPQFALARNALLAMGVQPWR